jgi:hypothetical protein
MACERDDQCIQIWSRCGQSFMLNKAHRTKAKHEADALCQGALIGVLSISPKPVCRNRRCEDAAYDSLWDDVPSHSSSP